MLRRRGREYARRVMFRGAFTREVRVALKHMARASSVLSRFRRPLLVLAGDEGRRRINKIPRSLAPEEVVASDTSTELRYVGREKWPKI